MGEPRKKETLEEHWKQTKDLERNCEFKNIRQKDLITSNFITNVTDENISAKKMDTKLTGPAKAK